MITCLLEFKTMTKYNLCGVTVHKTRKSFEVHQPLLLDKIDAQISDFNPFLYPKVEKLINDRVVIRHLLKEIRVMLSYADGVAFEMRLFYFDMTDRQWTFTACLGYRTT